MHQLDLERFIFPYLWGRGCYSLHLELYVLQPDAFWQMKCISAETLHSSLQFIGPVIHVVSKYTSVHACLSTRSQICRWKGVEKTPLVTQQTGEQGGKVLSQVSSQIPCTSPSIYFNFDSINEPSIGWICNIYKKTSTVDQNRNPGKYHGTGCFSMIFSPALCLMVHSWLENCKWYSNYSVTLGQNGPVN